MTITRGGSCLFGSLLAACSPAALEAPRAPVVEASPAAPAGAPQGPTPATPVAVVPAASLPSLPSPPPPAAPPPPLRRRPDGIRYGVAGGLGVGLSRPGSAPQSAAGVAALGTIWVGISTSDLLVVALRVDVGGVVSDALGDLGVHLAFFPAGDQPGPVGDLQVFADACLGGPLAQGSGPGTPSSSSITGLGRIGVAWERFRVATVALGPFLGGQMARGGGESQAAVLGGVSASFTVDRRKGP